jgi:molybdopterin molybdotransferase
MDGYALCGTDLASDGSASLRQAGEDLAVGEVAVPSGRRLTAADLGLLASLGRDEVEVFRKPRVAFFSTGDELRSLGEPLGQGEVYDSNRYTLFRDAQPARGGNP